MASAIRALTGCLGMIANVYVGGFHFLDSHGWHPVRHDGEDCRERQPERRTSSRPSSMNCTDDEAIAKRMQANNTSI